MVQITPKIAAGMVAQVERDKAKGRSANPGGPMPREAYSGAPIRVSPIPTRAESEAQIQIARLTDMLEKARAVIAEQAETIKALREEANKGALTLYGRPALTPREASERTGISVSQISRYCDSGHWLAEQPDGKHWLIYSDQPLSRPNRKRGGK
jgi:hypothetical protein